MTETDLYQLLGVGRDAAEEDIKRAYRQKARELHPDATGGDAATEERFKEVSLAYEVLRDPERRARYDRFGAEGVFGPAAGQGGFGSPGTSSAATWAISSRRSSRAVPPVRAGGGRAPCPGPMPR